MQNLTFLYQYAEENGIQISPFYLPENGSLCIQNNGKCFIAIDEKTLETDCNRCVHLAHEIGHCMTGSFYNKHATCDIRAKHEYRADKWAIEHTLTADDLDSAIADGYTEIWSLSERFGVTENFMRKAVCWYIHGNLSADLYF